MITLYDPNISKAQNRVNPLMPAKSNDTKSTRPKDAQKRDCDVSKRLRKEEKGLNSKNLMIRNRIFCEGMVYQKLRWDYVLSGEW